LLERRGSFIRSLKLADVLPDEEHGMYTAEMDPKKGPIKIPQHEVARQRAAAQALKASLSCSQSESSVTDSDFGNSIVSSPRSSPTAPDADEDWSWMTHEERKKAETAKKAMTGKPVQPPRCLSAPGTKAPKKSVPVSDQEAVGKPATRLRAVAGPSTSPRDPETAKAAAPQRAPAEKGQESPGTKVPPKPAPDPHPMATRRQRQASGAGGLRPGGGSGQTDTRVDLFHPSKT
jgi:hypothetical protein